MAYYRSKSGGGSSKYLKCKWCYAKNRFCTHQSGGFGKKSYGKARGYPTRGSSYKKKRLYTRKVYKKKEPEPTKINVPVLDSGKNEAPDMVPMNGVRVRCTRLTDPKPVRYESKKFAGTVCWRGVTDAFNYEMNGDGPFVHRRMLFQGPWAMKFDNVELVKLSAPSSEWSRSAALPLGDPVVSTELQSMFGASATVRDLLFSSVKGHGYNVVADSRKQYEGKASGTRKFQKYFKGFGKTGRGTVIKYNLDDNGVTNGDVADDEKYQHIYAMDIFQYGINGLDQRLSSFSSAGKKRPLDQSASASSMKRHKSDKSDSSYEDVSMEGLDLGGDAVEEKALSGVVRVVSNMKLYWYDPK